MIEINPRKLVRNVSKNGEFIFRGGLALQAELGAQNARQFGRFLRTPQGARFIAQQALLQSQNPDRRKNIIKKIGDNEVRTQTTDQNSRLYNPGAPLLAKALSQEFTSQKPKRHIDLSRFGDPVESRTENAVRFFDKDTGIGGSLQVRYGNGKVGDFPDRINNKGEAEVKDFIKFRIRDAVNGRYIIFPALLSGAISDNSSQAPGEIQYIGRPDKIYVYGGYTRSISFSVNIVAQRKSDIPIIWEKINYAKGLVLPQYKEFFAKTEKGVTDRTRPVAPLCNLTLGDLFNDAPGFFTSVNMSIPESATWELSDGQQVPHICSLGFEFTYLGKENPTMTSNHFDNISKKFPIFKDPDNPDQQKQETEQQAEQKSKRQQRQDDRAERQKTTKPFSKERRQMRRSQRQARNV